MSNKIYDLLYKLANKSSSIDRLYPVGTIYTTTSSTFNPNTIFGGTWTQLTNDAYLKTAETAGSTGGSGTSGAASGNTGSHTITTSELPAHSHAAYGWGEVITSGSYYVLGGVSTSTAAGKGTTRSAGGGGSHNHSLNSHTHTVSPSYYGVYVWKRTT